MKDKSITRANQMINYHMKNIELLGAMVKSIVLVGSLTNDSYTGNVGSDIDLIHVICNTCDQKARDAVLRVIERTQSETNYDIPISKCVYRYSDLFHPYKVDFELSLENKDYLELPIEVLRMKESGITIYGENIIDRIDVPAREDVIAFETLSRKWNEAVEAENPELAAERNMVLENPSARLISQIVLTGAMLDYFFATNKSCSSKRMIAEVMINGVPNYRFQDLLELAVKWRHQADDFLETDEQEMKNLFMDWKSIREGQSIGSVPLL